MKDEKLDQYYDILKMIEAAQGNTRFLMAKIAKGEKVDKDELTLVESEIQAFLDKLEVM
tara:strand:- start:2626 stop:2802 length:177 start_codon:yes stop_codon:yes gene_type:complete